MSLEQAALLGQVIAAIAVLGSLVFVGLQIRQNSHFQKLAAVDRLSAAIACINVKGMESPALGEALAIASREWGAATREQRIIAHYFLFSYFKLAENAWYQREAGVLEPAQWYGWETMVRFYYHAPGVRLTWWPSASRRLLAAISSVPFRHCPAAGFRRSERSLRQPWSGLRTGVRTET